MQATASLWASTSTTPSFSPLSGGDLHVDVAVVGGGITGVTAALLLKRAGKKVALVEARRIGSGVTGGTTSHLTEMLDARYHELERNFGADGARMARESSREAIDLIERLDGEAGAAGGFTRVPGILFARNEEQANELRKEQEAIGRAGLPAKSVPVDAPFSGVAAIRVENQGKIHPLRYLHALASRIPGDGSHVFDATPIHAIEEAEPCTIRSEAGAALRANHVILATHAPLTRVFFQTKVAQYRSYVVSGPCERELPGLYWDLDDPYHYVRTELVDGTPHFIAGGEDHKTGQEDDTPARFDRLTAYARSLGFTNVTRAWSAQVVEPHDGLPYIGPTSSGSPVLLATGYSGNGITFGTIAARILADACLGSSNPFAELFDSRRMPKVKLLPEYVEENVDFPLELVRGTIAPKGRSASEIPRDHGEVIRSGGKLLAVYREPSGVVQAVSAVCTHMGCVVAFNAAEKTWDCPCHGSRFALDGTVLDGPAWKPLERRFVVE